MSEYTREEILKLIEENGGPEGLDLSGKDLSGIDLSDRAILAEIRKREMQGHPPIWASPEKGKSYWWANLRGINLRYADLSNADLQLVDLRHAKLFRADLHEANLLRANLQEADLVLADLSGANLWKANLKWANLLLANLRGALLSRESIGNALLQESTGKLKEIKLEESIKQRYLANRLSDAREIYLALENVFQDNGYYDDASWAYRKARQMEKMSSAPWRARKFHGENELGDVWAWDHEDRIRKWESGLPTRHPRVLWFYTRHTSKWLADWLVELLCDYGESIWRVLAWMLIVILGFAAYYQVSHAVVTSSREAVTSVWDHLIFSLGAFTTLQPARLQAARPGAELLTTIQAIIGISLAGLLGFVAGNRIRRS